MVFKIKADERLYESSAPAWLFNEHKERYNFALELLKGKKVLDVACGSGYGSKILSELNDVVGMDISAEAIDYANKRYKNKKCKFIQGDAEDLPFPNSSFDAVVSFETIEHLENPIKFIKEIERILKDKGIFIVSTPNKEIFSPLCREPLISHHVKEFRINELTALFKTSKIKLYGQHFVNSTILPANAIINLCFMPFRVFKFMKDINRMFITLSNKFYYSFEKKGVDEIKNKGGLPSVFILLGQNKKDE